MDIHSKRYSFYFQILSNIIKLTYIVFFQLSKPAKECNENDRADFVLHMMQYTPNQLVFSDELAYDRRVLFRRYGWSKSGFCAQKPTFFVRGKRYTVEAALCINGLLAYGIQEGPMDTLDYENFIEFVLVCKFI